MDGQLWIEAMVASVQQKFNHPASVDNCYCDCWYNASLKAVSVYNFNVPV